VYSEQIPDDGQRNCPNHVTCSIMVVGRPNSKRLLKTDMSLSIFRFWIRYVLGRVIWGGLYYFIELEQRVSSDIDSLYLQ